MSELFYSLPTWDLHNFGSLFNQNFSQDAWDGHIGGSPEQIFRSPEMDMGDVSTGYLEDALIEFSERSKRRRLSFNAAEDTLYNDFDHSQNNWGLSENYSCTSSQFADESPNSSINLCSEEKSSNRSKNSFEPSSSTTSKNSECDNKKRVVYPFGVVKPGGREEDVTLNDINKRILMPSARPVRHPVGVFACRPCVSADGPGLSGKAVVAFTKIQTLGRGTITIIRTKG
ncbi:Protein XRI1 [Cardamine amara subsp. amara]|uniref:Protein XRI1 n=1 Tax=Cardamine amara subsp. amara TaxID=228776 RepID=A0ABD1APZ7_CARAN